MVGPESLSPGGIEEKPYIEILHPGDFYAAYIFDHAVERQSDIAHVIEQAHQLGYPVRTWWLSQAMDLQGSPDRLIVCVHHPGIGEEAGMDLYDALQKRGITWDELDSAVMEEYHWLGQPALEIEHLTQPDGTILFRNQG